MFGIEPTPFDLQFSLGRIPVRVHPGFWIVGVLGGWREDDLRFTFIWVMCLFVSILIHELGHALISEAFGWPSEILLYHFGGLAFSQRYSHHTPWRSIAVSIAGPAAGFAFLGVIVLAVRLAGGAEILNDPYVRITNKILMRINFWWGMLNLAPVLPLDGGQICRSFLEWTGLRNFEVSAIRISLVIGSLLAWYFLSHDEQFAGMLFLFLTMQNFMSLQQIRGQW